MIKEKTQQGERKFIIKQEILDVKTWGLNRSENQTAKTVHNPTSGEQETI